MTPVSSPRYTGTGAYPYTGKLCGANPGAVKCCGSTGTDWENCTFTQECGASAEQNFSDVNIRKKYAKVPHMGGVNIGFADGHAKWYLSETILADSPDDPRRAGMLPAGVYEERQGRQGLFDGFLNGICLFHGDFGSPS
jgi:prepilin-type processing-associated H-X9-DG protein